MKRTIVTAAVVATVAAVCMLGLNRSQKAYSEEAISQQPQPFANAVQQRQQANAHLKEIRDLLQEQNALLTEQNKLLHTQIGSQNTNALGRGRGR